MANSTAPSWLWPQQVAREKCSRVKGLEVHYTRCRLTLQNQVDKKMVTGLVWLIGSM